MLQGRCFCLTTDRYQFVHSPRISSHVNDIEFYLLAFEIGQGVDTPRTSRLDEQFGFFHFLFCPNALFEERVDGFRFRVQIVFHEQAFGLLNSTDHIFIFLPIARQYNRRFFVIQIWFGCLFVFRVEPLAVTVSLQQDEKAQEKG